MKVQQMVAQGVLDTEDDFQNCGYMYLLENDIGNLKIIYVIIIIIITFIFSYS